MSGSCRLEQHNRSCALCPGDWSVVDTRHPFHIWSLARRNENLSLRLERPSDPELLSLLPRGAARLHGTTGASRILQATLRETFSQMGCLLHVSETGLQRAVAKMVWSALQEQLEAPPLLAHQDVRRARIKSFIELRLEDPDLSVESVAQTCGVSVRSLHRAFAADPAGSVSKYIWVRRLAIAQPTYGIPGRRIGRSRTSAFLGASTAPRISAGSSRTSSVSRQASIARLHKRSRRRMRWRCRFVPVARTSP